MSNEIAKSIEHTLLKAAATPTEVAGLCAEARRHGFHGVCVSPLMVAVAARELAGAAPCVVSVVAFPLGATVPSVAAAEARQAVADGASELDLVIPIGLALAGDHAAVTRAVATVREAAPRAVLKVILETGHFTAAQLLALARAALAGGPDFLKTSTGFGPRGATVEDVRLLLEAADGRARVKAAGGVRTLTDAQALLAAGAARLGTSSGVAIVTGQVPGASY